MTLIQLVCGADKPILFTDRTLDSVSIKSLCCWCLRNFDVLFSEAQHNKICDKYSELTKAQIYLPQRLEDLGFTRFNGNFEEDLEADDESDQRYTVRFGKAKGAWFVDANPFNCKVAIGV